ncbi:MAG: hypothetical protein CMJ84_18285 [Planctomycetes bacterium]|jgi:hypothetical protein|nr:hypothetical protein [Planctomycetota bacterium]MDP6410521.1 hypothetical protein [Planctomycetota bacterium]
MTRFTAFALPLSLLLFASSASAQDFEFDIDQPSSSWTWSGNTGIGPMLPLNPGGENFELDGSITLALDSGGNPIGGGQITSANAILLPDLHAYIPNPIPGWPPLALIDLEGVSYTFVTPTFSVNNSGQFSADWTLTFLSGILTVTPLAGSVSVTDLTGIAGDATPNSGTFTTSGSQIHLASAQVSDFSFVDSGTGISADLHLEGDLVADYGCPAVTAFCFGDGSGTACPCSNGGASGEGCANGTGSGAIIGTSGSTSIAAGDLVLAGSQLVPNQPGLYFQGDNAVSGGNGVTFGDGLRCAGGNVVRLQVRVASGSGTSATTIDIAAKGGVSAGDTKHYQVWYRDPASTPCGTTFNLSNGVSVFFCP